MASLLQLFITGLGAFIVSWIPLAILLALPESKQVCSSANIFDATQCVSAETYAGVTYLVFIALSLVYAEIKRKGIDTSSSSIEILLHDYAFKKNYSQRVHAVRYAFAQALFAGIFVANIGYPFVIPAAASTLSEWPPDGATMVWNTGIGNIIINYWWIIPLFNIPLYWLMSMNRIGAENFISSLQLTQKRIDYYSSHGSEVAVVVKRASVALPPSSVESAVALPQSANEEQALQPQEEAGPKWHETPLFYCLSSAVGGLWLGSLVIIPKTFSISLIFTTVITIALYLFCVLSALMNLDRATPDGRIAGYIAIGLLGFWGAGANQNYVYGLWGIDYFLRITLSIVVGLVPLIYVWMRRIGAFPIDWDSANE